MNSNATSAPLRAPGQLVRIGDAVPWLRRPALRALAHWLERALALDVINRVHAATATETEPAAFLRAVLKALEVRYDVKPEALLQIPATGPVVVVSNHPFGGLDAIILTAVLTGIRPDARILANHLLMRLPQLRSILLPVDPFGGPDATRRNVQGMQRALAHLHEGGLLGVFPGGAVSHFQWRRMAVEDPVWSRHVFRLVKRTGATVVPVFFSGRNSLCFQLAGLLHPLLRTAMIPREVARRRGSIIPIVVGRPIRSVRLKKQENAEQFSQFLRLQTYLLGEKFAARRKDGMTRGEPLAAEEPAERLAAEVAALPEDDVLVRDGDFLVGVARAGSQPALLREIGRLREETFRAAGEGTGAPRDLDRFDDHYRQLFLWDDAQQCVAGGYRIARVDRVLRERGQRGLYTASLFRFRPGFLRKLGPALELGRSWVRLEYQRKHNALALLWRGISTLVAREPECALLMGPVSISRDYQPLSRGLIVSFLKHTRLDRRLAAFVRPSRPYRMRGRVAQLARDVGDAVNTIDDVSMFVSEIEADGKGVPLLFRHYLRFHSIVLNFNVDPEFSEVVDGLILTDLRRSDPALLRRFMGVENFETFAAYHANRRQPRSRDQLLREQVMR